MTLSEYFKMTKIRQKVFADKIGSTEAAVSQYVAGKRVPSLGLAVRIFDVTMGAVDYRDMLLLPSSPGISPPKNGDEGQAEAMG